MASTLLTGLSAFYQGNESSGNLLDATATINLPAVGSPANASPAKAYGSARTIASANRFEAASSSTFQLGASGDISFSVWFYLTALNGVGNDVILIKSDAESNREYALYRAFHNNKLMWWLGTGSGTNAVMVESDETISLDTWYHAVGWRDATTGQMGLSLNNATPVTAAFGSSAGNAGTSKFRIGALITGMIGYVAEIGIWNRALTSDERSEIYNDGNGLAYPFSPAGMGILGGKCTTLSNLALGSDFICPADAIEEVSTGGVVIGGSAIETLNAVIYEEIGSGGVVAGGLATHNVIYSEPYFGCVENEEGSNLGNMSLGELILGGGSGECVPTFEGSGVKVGGSAIESLNGAGNYEEVGSGGVVVGGAALNGLLYSAVGLGGVGAGGSSIVDIVLGVPVSGGVVINGTSSNTLFTSHVSTGGVVCDGVGIHALHLTHAPAGGVVSGGASISVRRISIAASGGIVMGGTSLNTVSQSPSLSGGLRGGGNTLVHMTYTRILSGGAKVGGSVVVDEDNYYSHTPSGGCVVNGSAGVLGRYDQITSGGAVVAGATSISAYFPLIPTGGVVVGDLAITRQINNLQPSGGMEMGGTAEVISSHVQVSEGGLKSGGTAVVTQNATIGGDIYIKPRLAGVIYIKPKMAGHLYLN